MIFSSRDNPQKRWEHFSHEADIGVRGIGPTLKDAFEMAATALTAVITDPQNVKAQTPVTIKCQAPDRELLLYEWLNHIIYELDTRRMLFSKFEIEHMTDTELQATIYGENVNHSHHNPAVDVKGATMTELRVYEMNGGQCVAQCVVDV